MPYEWQPPKGDAQQLHLWPHRSLTQHGFVWFVGSTAALIAVPLISILGTPVLWALLPFLAVTVWALWFALRKNGRDRDILEQMELAPSRIILTRHEPKGDSKEWTANPYWVRVTLHKTGGPVPHYLTLRGEDREVEVGSFLSEDERIALANELETAIAALRS